MTHVPTTTRGRFIGGAAAASAVAFGFPAIISAQSKEIVIGLNVPQSGPYADQGKDQLRAYNLAIDEINKSGGIMGMQVKAVGRRRPDDGRRRARQRAAHDRTRRRGDDHRRLVDRNGGRRVGALPAKELAVHGDAHARRRDDEPKLPQAHVPPLQRCVHERAVAGAHADLEVRHRHVVPHHGRLLVGLVGARQHRRRRESEGRERDRERASSSSARPTSRRRSRKRKPRSPTCSCSPSSAPTW